MPTAATLTPAPSPRERFRELLAEKFGSLSLKCQHKSPTLVICRGGMFVRCDDCGYESEGITIWTPLRGQE